MDIARNNKVRVRFAPSPTGFFHIGSARTALFNWLYARHTGGTFILRIEDTDSERNTPEALQCLMDDMRWLGLDWDEGPEIGGEHGPYFQSQRTDLYKKYIQQLLDEDKAYEKDGAIWFRVSGEPQVIEDEIRARVERLEEKDFVIVRSNGMPVFHFVVVVDDMTMGITHVIRGEDHLSNTSKHTELFKAFGAPVPKFAHIPLILKSNGPGKMSKRDVGALIKEYQTRHFIPEAVRNYLCLLGWSPKDDREVLPIKEIIELFDLKRVNRNNARFDEQKLSFINAEYTRSLPLEEFAKLARPALVSAEELVDAGNREDYLLEVLALCQEKVRSIEELPHFVRYFFNDSYLVDHDTEKKVFKKGDPVNRLQLVKTAFAQLNSFTPESIEQSIQQVASDNNLKPNEFLLPIRFAVSGMGMGPSFYLMLSLLGKEIVLNRIDQFLEKYYSKTIS